MVVHVNLQLPNGVTSCNALSHNIDELLTYYMRWYETGICFYDSVIPPTDPATGKEHQFAEVVNRHAVREMLKRCAKDLNRPFVEVLVAKYQGYGNNPRVRYPTRYTIRAPRTAPLRPLFASLLLVAQPYSESTDWNERHSMKVGVLGHIIRKKRLKVPIAVQSPTGITAYKTQETVEVPPTEYEFEVRDRELFKGWLARTQTPAMLEVLGVTQPGKSSIEAQHAAE